MAEAVPVTLSPAAGALTSMPTDPALPFEALFMASPIAASVSRLSDGRLVAVNDAWLALTGLRREDAIGRTTVEIGHWTSEEAREGKTVTDSTRPGLR